VTTQQLERITLARITLDAHLAAEKARRRSARAADMLLLGLIAAATLLVGYDIGMLVGP
jgi:hypothetical protein